MVGMLTHHSKLIEGEVALVWMPHSQQQRRQMWCKDGLSLFTCAVLVHLSRGGRLCCGSLSQEA